MAEERQIIENKHQN